jgi:ABC-type multidrug transport system fused ATPase/permease subunit
MYVLFNIGNVELFLSAMMAVWMCVAYATSIRWTDNMFGRKLFSLILTYSAMITLFGVYDTSKGIIYAPAAMPPLWYLIGRIIIFGVTVAYIPWYTYQFMTHAGMHPEWMPEDNKTQESKDIDMAVEAYPHVADLGAVTDILGGVSASPAAKPETQDGETKRHNPQSNHLEPRQFGNQPSSGPEGSTGEPTGMGVGQDAMTMGSGTT